MNKNQNKFLLFAPKRANDKKPHARFLFTRKGNRIFKIFTSHFFVPERNRFIEYHTAIKVLQNFIAPKTPLCKRCEKSRAAVSGAFSFGGGLVIAMPANRQALAKASVSDAAAKRQKEKAAHPSDLINAEDSMPGCNRSFPKKKCTVLKERRDSRKSK